MIGTEVIHGVDYCKQLLPEFNIVKQMADGRASEICQEESRLISNEYFTQAVNEGRNFGWDSSMSNLVQTQLKIDHAKARGYHLELVAVLTRPEVAIRRAMARARLTKRFPPPKYLESSHQAFCANLMTYVPQFDRVWVLENSKDDEEAMVIATKPSIEAELEIFDANLFETYLNTP